MVRRNHCWDGARRGPATAALLLFVLAQAAAAPCRADDQPQSRWPAVDDAATRDGQEYSYYYVPRLSELNQLVGYLFRTGLVHKDATDRDAVITRYAAYSCEGTLFVGASPGTGTAEDVDWSQVTALRAGPASGPPAVVVERAPLADSLGRPLVLYVADSTIRYQLHQALAVLVSECRPRPERGGSALGGR